MSVVDMPIGGTNFGYLYACDLEANLDHLAQAGIRHLELGVAPPHVAIENGESHGQIGHLIASRGLQCVSINPAELNLITQNRDLAVRQYGRAIELAGAIGAGMVVMIPGRQSPLRRIPEKLAVDTLSSALDRLSAIAEKAGVDIVLEAVPFGFLEHPHEIAALIRKRGDPRLGIALDCANLHVLDVPVHDYQPFSDLIRIAHASDCWKGRWAHTSVGRGDVDFGAYFHALRDAGYHGPTIYELFDSDDPRTRLDDDRTRLESFGWSRRTN